ncbi:hypothetical protein V1477_008870 [Vespula maculifrons]|uniref:Uncharacterized protein n=1 Tax=Vespula maculifrons TaxID=7453 RepID=A0ABD2CE83_VESMC
MSDPIRLDPADPSDSIGRPVCFCFVVFGPIRTYSILLDLIWSSLVLFDSIRSCSVLFGPVRIYNEPRELIVRFIIRYLRNSSITSNHDIHVKEREELVPYDPTDRATFATTERKSLPTVILPFPWFNPKEKNKEKEMKKKFVANIRKILYIRKATAIVRSQLMITKVSMRPHRDRVTRYSTGEDPFGPFFDVARVPNINSKQTTEADTPEERNAKGLIKFHNQSKRTNNRRCLSLSNLQRDVVKWSRRMNL